MSGLFPKSLFGRMVLVLSAGLLVAQLLSVALHLMERQHTVVRAASNDVVQRVVSTYRALDSQIGSQRASLAKLLGSANFALTIEAANEAATIHSAQDQSDFSAMLGKALGPDVAMEAIAVPRLGTSLLELRLRLSNGQWLRIKGGVPKEFFAFPTHLFVNLAIMFFSLAGLSWFAVRKVTQPLGDLARAAHALGQDINRAPLPETGPAEVADAAKEFNAMQSRLRQSIDERARFLAAISHDLKTPITRMRLRAEMIPNPAMREKFASDLKEMADMVSAALGFLRGESTDESLRPVDIAALVESTVEDFVEAGAQLTLNSIDTLRLNARPHALRRCLNNLIDNAVKYGVDDVSITIESSPHALNIFVRDRGPGIPRDELDKVFEPFYRLETSRSRDTGGTGLGLAIARQIALAHGGDIVLNNRPDGGLESVLRLPTCTTVRV